MNTIPNVSCAYTESIKTFEGIVNTKVPIVPES